MPGFHSITREFLVLLLFFLFLDIGLIVAQRSYRYPKEGSYATYVCKARITITHLSKNYSDFGYKNLSVIYYWKILEVNRSGIRVFVRVNASYSEKFGCYLKRFPPLSRDDVVEISEGPRNISFSGIIFVNLEKGEAYYNGMRIEPPRFWWPVDLVHGERIEFGRTPDGIPLKWDVSVYQDTLPDPTTGVPVKWPEFRTPLGIRKYSDVAILYTPHIRDPLLIAGYSEVIYVDRVTGIALGSASYSDGVLKLMGIYGITATDFGDIDGKIMHASCIMKDAHIEGAETVVLSRKTGSPDPLLAIAVIASCGGIIFVYYRIRKSSKKVR